MSDTSLAYALVEFTTSRDFAQPLITSAGWPPDLHKRWPPYFCPKCSGMRFYYNYRMAQCFYCSHIILNWGCKDDPGSVANDP